MTRLTRPTRHDLKLIGFYVARVVQGIALLHLLPLAVAVAAGEVNDATAILFGGALAGVAGTLLERRLRSHDPLDWGHGLVIVALSWLVAPLFLAVSLYLSGHFGGFLDAFFDAMSGLTTSGLSLLQDLDHLGAGMQVLRHLSHFAGGQGIIVVVLTVIASAGGGVGTLYVGEGREERLVPNIIRTARFIYLIAAAWMLVGTSVLLAVLLRTGLDPFRATWHAATLFWAAFDTGGFAPHSTSIAYYHDPLLEFVLVVLMIAGGLSFPIHYQLWQRRVRRVAGYSELRVFAWTTGVLTTLVLVGLALHDTYQGPFELFRKGVFTAISAATGTGFTVITATEYSSDWGDFAPVGIVVLMALGAMAGSTAGGVKASRVAVVSAALVRDLRKALAPPDAVVVAVHRTDRRRTLQHGDVRAAMTIVLLFLLTYVGGAMVAVYHGSPLEQALFESTSATANVGLTAGVLSPDNPVSLKLTFITQMWLGRLEFLSAFALVGYGVAFATGGRRGRTRRSIRRQ